MPSWINGRREYEMRHVYRAKLIALCMIIILILTPESIRHPTLTTEEGRSLK